MSQNDLLRDLYAHEKNGQKFSDFFPRAQEVYDVIRKARTDTQNEVIIQTLKNLGFEHKVENGFHHVEGYGFEYKHVLLGNILARLGKHIEGQKRPTKEQIIKLRDVIAEDLKKEQLNYQYTSELFVIIFTMKYLMPFLRLESTTDEGT